MNTIIERENLYVTNLLSDVNKLSNSYLLTDEEEQELFSCYETSVEAKEALKCEYLSKDEISYYERLVHLGSKAKDILLNKNQRLVISIARTYMGRGLDLSDLIQEGNMGLLKAIEKFDYTLGNKFSTYATYWIKQSIGRAVGSQGSSVRIPSYVREQINQVRTANNVLTNELGREPSAEELAKYTNFDVGRIYELNSYMQKVESLDEAINEKYSKVDLLADSYGLNPEEQLVDDNKGSLIMSLLSELSEKDKDIIVMHFGLNNSKKHTLEEIGSKYNLTRERIRQIEDQAFKKIRLKYQNLSLADVL